MHCGQIWREMKLCLWWIWNCYNPSASFVHEIAEECSGKNDRAKLPVEEPDRLLFHSRNPERLSCNRLTPLKWLDKRHPSLITWILILRFEHQRDNRVTFMREMSVFYIFIADDMSPWPDTMLNTMLIGSVVHIPEWSRMAVYVARNAFLLS